MVVSKRSDSRRSLFWLLMAFALTTGCAPTFEPTEFFPSGAFSNPDHITAHDQFYARWFGTPLAAMREKPLRTNLLEHDQVIRISVHPSWSTASMARLMQSPDGNWIWEYKDLKKIWILEGGSSDKPGRLDVQRQGVASEPEGRAIDRFLTAIGPVGSALPTHSESACTDGTTFVFEFFNRGVYNVLERHICDFRKSSSLRNFLILVNRISGGTLANETYIINGA